MYYLYIMTNQSDKVMYIGVTNDLKRRVSEHKSEKNEGFTSKYKLKKLVYFESFSHPDTAIKREKQLKGWKREKKNNLVSAANPDWIDLADKI